MSTVVPGEPALGTTEPPTETPAETPAASATAAPAGAVPGPSTRATTVRLVGVVAVTTANAVVAVKAGPAAVAVPAGLLLALVLPGTALTAALFGRRALNSAERVVLAPALSLAAVVVTGLLLNAAGARLDRGSWATALAGVTAAALLVTAWSMRAGRQPATAEPLAAGPRPGSAAPATGGRRLGWQVLALVLTAVMLGGAGWFSYANARDTTDRTVTAMSVTRQELGTAGRRSVDISVTGLQPAHGPYILVAKGPDGRTVQARRITTGTRTWSGTLLVSALDRITIDLYRAGETTIPYRTVLLSPRA